MEHESKNKAYGAGNCIPNTHFISNKINAVQAKGVEIRIPCEELGQRYSLQTSHDILASI